MKILIVDDYTDFREILADIFKEDGYTVYQANNGVEGLAMYLDVQPDRVLSDWNMPLMNGFDMVTKILELDPAAKILMMTAGGMKDAPVGITIIAKEFTSLADLKQKLEI